MNRTAGIMMGVMALLLLPVTLAGETFFLAALEVCNDQPVELESSAREGVMDGMFEAGHIIFDDIAQKDAEIKDLLYSAWKYGARYLIYLTVQSRETIIDKKTPGKVESTAVYSLYDVKSNEKIGEGTIEVNNHDREAEMDKKRLWFDMGASISEEIENFYLHYVKK